MKNLRAVELSDNDFKPNPRLIQWKHALTDTARLIVEDSDIVVYRGHIVKSIFLEQPDDNFCDFIRLRTYREENDSPITEI